MLFPVECTNISNDQLFEKFDVSIKNKGAKISIRNRKLAMTQFLARVHDLEDLPKQMSNLFPVIRQGFNICCLTMLHQAMMDQVQQKIS